MTTDIFGGAPCNALVGPYYRGVAVTKSDNDDLPNVSRAIWVGGAGNLNVMLMNGDTVLLSGIPAGTLIPIRAARVMATNTSATLIVALW